MDLAQRTAFVPDELEALFKFIPSPQLLKFRSVSEEWDEVAKMVLRKRRDIKLILTTDNFDSRFNWDFLQFLNESPPQNVFVAPVMLIKNANKPQHQDLEEGRTCISFQVIREICKILGNRGVLKELFMEDDFPPPHFTSDYVLVLLGHLPTLEKLDIWELRLSGVKTLTSVQKPQLQLKSLKQIYFGNDYGSDEKETENFLKIILESSPNLEKMTAEQCDPDELNIISMLRDTGRLSKMKEIKTRKPADLDILLQCQPKIVLHSLIIHSNVVDPKKLFTFLQQQSVNLKTFKFQCYGESMGPEIITLPFLPVLENLSFKPWESGCLLSVNYGSHTPALKTLMICSDETFPSWEHWEEFLCYEISSERPPCPTLEDLDLNIRGPTSQRIFDNWKNLFPSLKKLRIHGPEELDFDQVSKCWPNLENLTLLIYIGYYKDFGDLDEILFGIKPDWKGNIDATEEDWWKKIPEPEIKGTVANFKNLQKLDISVRGYWTDRIGTDFAVYFGLRKMQNLKELEITTNEGIMGVSTEAFNFLVKNLPKLEKVHLAEKKWKRGEILK